MKAQGGSDELRRTFYSSLYRSFLAPNIGSDVDGRYTGWDQKTHRAVAADGAFTYYQNWSLWDTYRTQAQLLSLLAPRESRDMAISVLRIDAESGWLPKWGYGTVETNIMTGDPVTPFLTNAYQQGLLKGHEEEAYRALKKNADGVPPTDSAPVGREANVQYLKDGFAPYIKDRPHAKPGDSDFDHGASATLEYALSDAMLGEMARDLGHDADAKRYEDRAQNYRKIFDSSTGFFRARDASGAFTGPADPAQSEGFHEGTSWQYQWLVPQDLPGMVGLIGGKDAANQRLDSFFAYDKLLADPAKTAREVWVNGPYAYYNADKYNPQNEPDLIAPYTYLSTGQPWKTTDVVHAALTLFTDAPTGMTGNDDLGTMSAWMVLSSIGVFPVQPGTDTWGLSTCGVRACRSHARPPLLPARVVQRERARDVGHRSLHPVGEHRRRGAVAYVPHHGEHPLGAVARLHRGQRALGMGHLARGRSARPGLSPDPKSGRPPPRSAEGAGVRGCRGSGRRAAGRWPPPRWRRPARRCPVRARG